MVLGKRIRSLRLRVGMTQEELATKIGVSRVYVVQLETGRQTNPTLKVLKALARVLKVKIADLLE